MSDAARKLILELARYSGAASLARPLIGGMGAILMLHRVTAFPDKPDSANSHLNIAPAFLDVLIDAIKKDGYAFVSMDEAVARIKLGAKGGRFVAITADDAYRDNLTEALPIFERHRTPFTVYVAPGLTDGAVYLWWEAIEDIINAVDKLDLPGRAPIDCSSPDLKRKAFAIFLDFMTNEVAEQDQVASLREFAATAGVDPAAANKNLMNWEGIATLAAHPLATIGAHTIHHYALKRLSRDDALGEMVRSAEILEARLGTRPRHFAYPYGYAGAVGAREVELASQAGFLSAVTTRHGILRPEHAAHLHALPRISINGRFQKVDYVRTMLSGVTTLLNSRQLVVTV
jgi:peptidoglycan/xylan/chitin deacetylase (PgdA/CDA1 family)